MAAIDDLSEPQYMAQSLGWNKRLLLRDRRGSPHGWSAQMILVDDLFGEEAERAERSRTPVQVRFWG